jgi:acetyl-CoA acyltransferase 1
VIVNAVRTAICKAKKGSFKDTRAEDLLAAALKVFVSNQAAVTQVALDTALVDDIIVGNVLPAGGGAAIARMAALYAG